MNLEKALERIKELEQENKKLKDELDYYKSKKTAGRKVHDDTWLKSYNDFAIKYKNGMSIMEIVAEGRISRRTAYRYKKYYDEMLHSEEAVRS